MIFELFGAQQINPKAQLEAAPTVDSSELTKGTLQGVPTTNGLRIERNRRPPELTRFQSGELSPPATEPNLGLV
jgi:hypothetical protein